MVKDKRVPVFIILFTTFLILFENSIAKIVALNEAKYLSNQNPVVNFEIAKNYGASWGIFQNSRFFLIAFGIFIMVLAFFYAVKKLTFKDKLMVLSFALFLSGVLGNTIERIKAGYVLDYIKIQFINFPIFNIFDICIVLGVLIFLVYELKQKGKAQ